MTDAQLANMAIEARNALLDGGNADADDYADGSDDADDADYTARDQDVDRIAYGD